MTQPVWERLEVCLKAKYGVTSHSTSRCLPKKNENENENENVPVHTLEHGPS